MESKTSQTQGDDFRYAVNFAIIAKMQGIAKFKFSLCTVTFAMISLRLRKFRYGCQIFAILAKFLQCIAKIMFCLCCLCIAFASLFHHFHFTFLWLWLMKSPRILAFSTNTKPSLLTEVPKTCKTTKNHLETKSIALSGPVHVNWLNSYD